jgi:hypothetical protein
MKSVRDARRLLLIIAVVLLVIDAAAIAWLFSPRGRGTRAHENELRELETEYRTKIREIGPARDMDKRLTVARQQQVAFYNEHIPTRYSAISETLGKLAADNHVQVSAVRYEAKDTDVAGVQRVGISSLVTGPYASEMQFINSLERSKTFFVINSVSLGGAEGGKVRLELHIETFLRSGS